MARRSADLRNARLCDADLRRAKFDHADLRGADLRGADLSNTSFWAAHLEGADLRGATPLTPAQREPAFLGADTLIDPVAADA